MKGDEKFDMVNNPPHYNSHASGVECIQITEHMNFCVGNAVKYLWRAGEKNDLLEDLKKARWYVDREIARVEKERADEAYAENLLAEVPLPVHDGDPPFIVSEVDMRTGDYDRFMMQTAQRAFVRMRRGGFLIVKSPEACDEVAVAKNLALFGIDGKIRS